MKTTTYLYRLMMTAIIISSSLLVQAQSPRLKAVHYANCFAEKGDTIDLVITGARGSLQWQKSLDKSLWENLPNSNVSTLKYKLDTTLFFRVKMEEENCDPTYSDTLHIAPAVISENVVLLDTTALVLNSDSTELSQGIYIYDLKKETPLDIGDVIVGQEQGGYIRKITGIASENNKITLTTEQAFLDDVFDEIYLNDSIQFSMDDGFPVMKGTNGKLVPVKVVYLAPGVALKSGSKGLSLNRTLMSESIGGKISTSLKTDGHFDLDITFKRNFIKALLTGFEHFYLYADCTMDYSQDVFMEFAGSGVYSPPGLPLAVFIIPCPIPTVPPLIGWFQVNIDLAGQVSLGGYVNLKTGFSSHYFSSYGLDYNKSTNNWAEIKYKEASFTPHPTTLDLGGRIETKVGVQVGLKYVLCFIDGPYIGIQPYLKAVHDFSGDVYNGKVLGGIEANAGFELGAFGYDAFSYKVNFPLKEWELASTSSRWSSIRTLEPDGITATSANLKGEITSLGDFNIANRYILWGISQEDLGYPYHATNHWITLGPGGIGLFTSTLTGLTSGVTNFYKVGVTEGETTHWGEVKSFIIGGGDGTFTDSRDGHIYKYKTIGTQTWMAENLAYLPAVSPSSAGSDANPYYYVYGYEGSTVASAKATANFATYGVLYNWPAALTACPSGWHLPSDAEWTVLTDYLTNNGYGYGGSGSDIGKSMASTSGWTSYSTAGAIGNDQSSNNKSGFTALPGGYRSYDVGFYSLGNSAFFWSASENGLHAWYRFLYCDYDGVYRDDNRRRYGFSARCLQN